MKGLTRIDGGVCAPLKFVAAAATGGIKNPTAERLDLALIYSEIDAVASGTFTLNEIKAAPVRLSQQHIADGDVRAIFANSGNANACTGEVGTRDAIVTVESVAKELKIREDQVAIGSTGVIGLPMPMDRLLAPIPEMVKELSRKAHTDVAKAIMTSDTTHKEIAVAFSVDGVEYKLGGCAKGAGMICPSMATMLCFITTDIGVSKEVLDKSVQRSVAKSFNRITIDGDMSTNDTVIVLANGAAGNELIESEGELLSAFQEALDTVMLELAKSLVRDGERVTKFVTVEVKGASTEDDGRKAAEAVANSALVKASWNGEDPNWGRIIHAVGYSGALLEEECMNISIEGDLACKGGLQADTSMEILRGHVTKEAFTICIDLGMGDASYEVYTSDMSPEYIDFNRSEYAYWKQARKDGLV